jgi:hypothetical protein
MPKGIHRRIVVPHPDGWQVRPSNGARASVVTQTKSEAVGRALEILRNLGGGELTVHDTDGRVTDSDTVASRDDPYPPLGADRTYT